MKNITFIGICVCNTRKLNAKLQFYGDTTEVVAKLPLAKKFPKYFDTKSKLFKGKLLGRLDLESLYLDFVSTVRNLLLQMTRSSDGERRFYGCADEEKVILDFAVCKEPQCTEPECTQTIRRWRPENLKRANFF